MTYSTAARRLVLRRIGAGIAALAASLVVVSSASAAVAVVAPDGQGGTTDNLGHAMQTAASAGGNQTLILQPGVYLPRQLQAGFGLPPVVSGEHLTIVLAHTTQAAQNQNASTIDGSFADSPHADVFTVDSGGSLNLQGVTMVGTNGTSANPDTNHSAIHVENGAALTLYGDLLAGGFGHAEVTVDGGATATINESTFPAVQGYSAIDNESTLTLNSDTIVDNTGTGLVVGGTTTANNTVFGNNGDGVSVLDCTAPIQNQDDVVDDDNSCTTGQNLGAGNGSSFTVPTEANNGGPTRSFLITGLPSGDPLQCPSTDQRFFVIPKSGGLPQCGTGAITSTAKQAVASNPSGSQVVDVPACVAQAPNYATTPATMTVNASDTGSGLGPMAGSPADSTTGSNLTPQTPPLVQNNPANTAAANPADAVSNAAINDSHNPTAPYSGTIAVLNPFSVPTFSTSSTTGQLQVEATKDASHNTRGDTAWSFDTTNWAGITAWCH